METESEYQLRHKLYDKRDDFSFPIVNFPFSSICIWSLYILINTIFLVS